MVVAVYLINHAQAGDIIKIFTQVELTRAGALVIKKNPTSGEIALYPTAFIKACFISPRLPLLSISINPRCKPKASSDRSVRSGSVT